MAGLVAAFALVPVARAEAPDGFRESPKLTVRAAKLSGKPDAKVYCASTIGAWARQTAGRPELRGQTNMRTLEMFLPRAVCHTLEGHLAGRAVLPRLLAFHLHVFGHETVHLRGWESEVVANCFAMRDFKKIARAFGISRPARVTSLRRILQAREVC